MLMLRNKKESEEREQVEMSGDGVLEWRRIGQNLGLF
jgi:hypothetical protein